MRQILINTESKTSQTITTRKRIILMMLIKAGVHPDASNPPVGSFPPPLSTFLPDKPDAAGPTSKIGNQHRCWPTLKRKIRKMKKGSQSLCCPCAKEREFQKSTHLSPQEFDIGSLCNGMLLRPNIRIGYRKLTQGLPGLKIGNQPKRSKLIGNYRWCCSI